MNMSAFLSDPPFWAWWILAVLVSAIELLAPTFFFLWIGAAAALTGVAVLLVPDMGWRIELVVFAGLSILGVWAWYRLVRRRPVETEDAALNRRAEQYVGRIVTLAEPIVDGFGTARVGDTLWRVAGADLPAGRRVRVVGARGTVLEVEPATEGPAPAGEAPPRPEP
ncbi:MAG: NfeD family protein [Rhodospirillaceae bacterium]|nr:NfeD family protein [Rhodospirillaceae bacterium]